MKNYTLEIKYDVAGKSYTTQQLETAHFAIHPSVTDDCLKMILDPKEAVKITSFKVSFSYHYSQDSKIYVNGYQSWTDSHEYAPHEKMPVLHKRVRKKVMNSTLCLAGDLRFFPEETEKGMFHGYSYSYVRCGKTLDLVASLNERSGYTILIFDVKNRSITAQKDLDGVCFTQPTEVMNLVWLKGDYDGVFDCYFERMSIPPVQKRLHSGYTTWYNYYNKITEKIVLRDLEALTKMPEKVEIFQIDDGFQTQIGDWLSTDTKKFPSGMQAAANAIHTKGMLAGLWLAPFAAVAKSKVFMEHPDWFLCQNGKPFLSGQNWGGFYALDIYNEGARSYIKHCFDVVLNEWNYDMVKLDFLYACCENPVHNKTRGQIMCDGMDFLRECVGDKLILGCGVPMAPAFGKVDFCRIGADMGLSWKHNKYTTREDVSTPNAVGNAVFRRHLDRRAFLNDPDVFLLRDDNIHMNFKKRKLIAKVNQMFGNLLFTSDNVEKYDDNQIQAFLAAINKEKQTVLSAEFTGKRVLTIKYDNNGQIETLSFNLEKGKIKK